MPESCGEVPRETAEMSYDQQLADALREASVRGREIDKLRAEIERLQKEWVSLYGVERMRFEAVQRMTDEIERLTHAIHVIGKRSAPTTHSLESAYDALKDINYEARHALEGQ
jgi:hypothetical protein